VVTAIVFIKARTAAMNELAKALVALKGITDVFSVAGRYDLVVLVRVKQNDDVAELVGAQIRKLPGIAAAETFIAFRAYVKADMDAVFSVGVN